MNRWRTVIALFAVLVWAFSAPLAMASSHCMAMAAMCEGPCGASSCAVAQPAASAALDEVSAGVNPASDHVSAVPLKVPELPPKSPFHSA